MTTTLTKAKRGTYFVIHNAALLLVYSTVLTQLPTPSSPTSTTSPSFNHTGGCFPRPTPDGLFNQLVGFLEYKGDKTMTHVPVKIKSPGKSVIPCDKNEMVLATLNIISLVEES